LKRAFWGPQSQAEAPLFQRTPGRIPEPLVCRTGKKAVSCKSENQQLAEGATERISSRSLIWFDQATQI